MQIDKNELLPFAEIEGVESASGLIYRDQFLYLIGDNSGYLYRHNIADKKLDKIRLLSKNGPLEHIVKTEKPDFEAICDCGETFLIIGSGSTDLRNTAIAYELKSEKVTTHDLSALYLKLKKTFKISGGDLNIEGAVFTGKDWFLFNRGNGKANKNGIFKISGKDLFRAEKFDFVPMILKKSDEAEVSFTDAFFFQNQIYFSAAAEDTRSTYDDGKILGSYVGCLESDTLKIKFIKKVSSHQKIEGITVLQHKGDKIELLLCADNDNGQLKSTIFKLIL